MTGLALIFIGFSLLIAISLGLTQFRPGKFESALARGMGLAVLAALFTLQVAHFAWLYYDRPWVAVGFYQLALFAVAPAFYLFSQHVLDPTAPQLISWRLVGHGAPVLVAWALPNQLAMPGAFLVGAGYLLVLGVRLYSLRRERAHFRLEILLLGFVFGVAIGVSVLGALQGLLPDKLFFSLYSCAIGVALFLVQLALGLRPNLATEVSETVQASYQSSCLNQVDCEAALARLAILMEQERLYTNNELSLSLLAQKLRLSTHQVSELLNSRLGKSFARFVREARVAAAKTMLIHEPAASVLSVGLSVGFTSQSTFYEAFREIEGMTPGQFRKLQGKASII